jgi:hypothetical protein
VVAHERLAQLRQPTLFTFDDGEQLGRVRGGRGDERQRAAGEIEAGHLTIAADDHLGLAVTADAVHRDVPGLVDLEQQRVAVPQRIPRVAEIRRAVQIE